MAFSTVCVRCVLYVLSFSLLREGEKGKEKTYIEYEYKGVWASIGHIGHIGHGDNGPTERDFRNQGSDGENFQRRGGTIAPRGGARIGTPGGAIVGGTGGTRAMWMPATADGDLDRLRRRWPARLEAIDAGEAMCQVQGDFWHDL